MKTYEFVWSPKIGASSDAGREGRVGTVIGDKIYYMRRAEGEYAFDLKTDECIKGPPFYPSKNDRSSIVMDGEIYRL